ncbi:MAG TPA: efflux RND transporter periplasmic adaptor subunit [Beijerinckiaceae bacterium]|nr:efflux RND transporter periplasmic adaptor subunit [Beijerinckiaceae bacterium]
MKWIKRLVLLLMLAAGGGGAWLWLQRGQLVVVQEVRRGTAAEIVYGTGVVEPVEWAKILAPVRARIEVHCRCEGRSVKAGDVLARLDEKAPRAELAQLEARKTFLTNEMTRQADLIARGTVSRQTYERAQSEFGQVEAQIAAATARLGDYTIVAPIDGVVLRADGQVGEIASTAEPLFWVGKPRPLHVITDVNEEDIARVREGQVVLLRSDAYADRALTATVASITPKGDPVRKTFRLYLGLGDDTPLRIGMSVEANIVTREKADVLVVPAEALRGSQVFVLEGEHARQRPVVIGIRGTRQIEIVEGLAAAEKVIAPVPAKLADGAKVRLIERTGP